MNINVKKAITFKEFRKNEEAQFRFWNCVKVCLVTVLSLALTLFFIYIILESNLIYFESVGYPKIDQFRTAFHDFVFGRMLHFVPYIILFFIMLVLGGYYVSVMLLRPFYLISEYCEQVIEGKEASYDPGFFSDLKLLARFSEWFFTKMNDAKKAGRLDPLEVPARYTRIHKPVFERAFFIQFSLFLVILCIIAYLSIYIIGVDFHQHLVEFSNKAIGNKADGMMHVMKNQSRIFSMTENLILGFHTLSYAFLIFHLYSKVAAPAFGIFATMRSFSKGNYSNRVHLIGFNYLRPCCRVINRYLDYMEKNYVKK